MLISIPFIYVCVLLYCWQYKRELFLKWNTVDLTILKRLIISSTIQTMEQRTLKNINNCLNTNIYSYVETSGGQSYFLYLNFVHFLTPA